MLRFLAKLAFSFFATITVKVFRLIQLIVKVLYPTFTNKVAFFTFYQLLSHYIIVLPRTHEIPQNM